MNREVGIFSSGYWGRDTEQQEIVCRMGALFALAGQLDARFKKAQAQVEKLTPSLLAKAFRGEFAPQDPNDEPAEKLLERDCVSLERCGAK